MNDTRTTLSYVCKLAIAEHGYSSTWTEDGEDALSLDEWWDSAQLQTDAEDRVFLYDGMTIFRQRDGGQDSKIILYRAEARCGVCKRFVREDRDQFTARRNATQRGEDVPSYCIRCASGGVIGPHLFG